MTLCVIIPMHAKRASKGANNKISSKLRRMSEIQITVDGVEYHTGDSGDITTIKLPGGDITFSNGSLLQVPTPAIIPQTLDLNTFKSTILSLSEADIRRLTNLSSTTSIKSIELSPSAQDIRNPDTGVLINTAEVRKVGNRFNVELSK